MGDGIKNKALKDELKHQAIDKKSELQKIEAKRKMNKLYEDSNKISLGSIKEEDIEKLVNGQKKALYSSLTGLEMTEDMGDLKEKVLFIWKDLFKIQKQIINHFLFSFSQISRIEFNLSSVEI